VSDKTKAVTDATFDQDVIKSEAPALVDFWAAWCGPCRAMSPVVDQIAEQYAGRVLVAKMNVDENPQTPARLGIMGIPTLILFAGGEEADRVVGVARKAVLESKLDALLAETKPS
jgi:thioredoxin 1